MGEDTPEKGFQCLVSSVQPKELRAARSRLFFLRQEDYNYQKYYMNADGEDNAKLRAIAEVSRAEMEDLQFLIAFYEEQMAYRKETPRWMYITIIVVSALSLIMAGIALWN